MHVHRERALRAKRDWMGKVEKMHVKKVGVRSRKRMSKHKSRRGKKALKTERKVARQTER